MVWGMLNLAFKIAVVMPAYNVGKFISKALDSIINQSMDFQKNIQIIIINDNSQDNTREIAETYQEKYPNNILLINNDTNHGASYSRNLGLKYVEAEYVNFLDSDDYITKGAFKKAYEFLNTHREVDIVSIPIYFFGVKKGPHTLNYKYEKTGVFNLHQNPSYIQLSGPSSFFRFSKLKLFQFNTSLRVSEDPLLINQMLIENPKIGFIHDEKYFYRRSDDLNSLIATSTHHKSYFTTRIDEYFLGLINYSLKKLQKVPGFIQHVLMYDLQWIFEIKYIHLLLNQDEINRLYGKLIYILSFIDDEIILSQLSLPIELKYHIFQLKHNKNDYIKNKDDFQCDFDLNTVYIDNFEFLNKNELYISGILTDFIKKTEISVCVNGQNYKTTPLNFPQRRNYSLNFDYAYNHNFEVILPIKGESTITFKADEKDLIIDYNHPSRLTRTSKYKLTKDYLAIDGINHIKITDKTILKGVKLEIKVLNHILKERKQGWRTGVILRILYFLYYYMFKNKTIWIFIDLPTSSGDNGFFLFNWACQNHDLKNIEKYYVFSKSTTSASNIPEMEYQYMASSRFDKIKRLLGFEKASEEYLKLQKIGKILPYKSLKHRMYLLFADVIIASHPDNVIIYPFWGNYPHLAGLAKSKTVFLQHGVTKDNISHWLNKYDKRINLITTVSEAERKSFLDEDYGYSEEIIKVLGFSRFDYLEKLEDKHEIVFMPTWRRQYDTFEDEQFIKTSYFKKINAILSDDKFIEYIESKGYKFIFKPHRNILKFLHNFTISSKIIIGDKIAYNDIFNHSSLVISDYSSVVFDFAYLKKPVLYYHPDKDYHFDVDKAYFKYDSMGFGEVCKSKDDLQSKIIELIENNCEMSDKYKSRVDDFFKYNDKNNCRRITDAILDLNDYY